MACGTIPATAIQAGGMVADTDGHAHGPVRPSAWIARFLGAVPPGGRVLDIAAGKGRHMRLALELGLMATGVDRDVSAITGLGGRVRGIVADQSRDDDLATLTARLRADGVRLDLVIDDCTHRPEDQLRKPGSCGRAASGLLVP